MAVLGNSTQKKKTLFIIDTQSLNSFVFSPNSVITIFFRKNWEVEAFQACIKQKERKIAKNLQQKYITKLN